MVKSGINYREQKLTDQKPAKSFLLSRGPVFKSKFSFSFQYFSQQPYFGVGDQDANWFVMPPHSNLSHEESSIYLYQRPIDLCNS
jgi:hypothetical protein